MMKTFTSKLFSVILPLVVLGGVTTSCTNELDVERAFVTNADVVISQSPYHISLSEAFDHLGTTFDAMGDDKTRAIERGDWSVQTFTISDFIPQTRTNGTTEDGDAIYVVNFDNDEGFAILSADSRLPDNVIAYGSKGNINLTPTPITEITTALTLEDLYAAEDDDYLLGLDNSDKVISGLVTNYVTSRIAIIGVIPGKDGQILQPPTNQVTYTYKYDTVEHIPEMLTTTWHQHSPYNDQCPNRYYYKGLLGITYKTIKPYNFDAIGAWGNNFVKEEDLTAGCVAIAVAQILAYNEFPSMKELLNDDNAMPWDSLKIDNINSSGVQAIQRQKLYKAKLVHKVGVGCDMNYGFYEEQSFATPAAAKRYLDALGYSNVGRTVKYDLDVVKTQLRGNSPVFIGALSGVVNGHAWVIDGYKKVQTIKIGKNANGEIVSSSVVSTNQYVHCNWGWGGYCDGWFTTGLVDESFSPNNDYEFDWWFRLVTYDKPNVEK